MRGSAPLEPHQLFDLNLVPTPSGTYLPASFCKDIDLSMGKAYRGRDEDAPGIFTALVARHSC